MLVLTLGQTRPAASTSATTKPDDYYALSAEEFFKRAEVREPLPPFDTNIPLLEAAIFHQTNLVRAAHKRPLFDYLPLLTQSGRAHSQEMAKLGYADHISPTPERRTPQMRMAAAGLKGFGTENVQVRPTNNAGQKMQIIIDAQGRQKRVDAATGREVENHTYASLARAALQDWMNSPGHRVTILDRSLVSLGVGAARKNTGEDDNVFLTQNFAAQPGRTATTRKAPTP